MRRLLLLWACGCNHLPVSVAAATPAADHEPTIPLFVVPDETMSFVVTLRGIQVANVQTAIGKPGWIDGKRAVILESLGHTEGVLSLLGDLRWHLESTIDLDLGTPISDHEEAWADLAGQKDHDDRHGEFEPGDDHHDIHSAIGTLRGWHGAPNEHREISLELGRGRIPIEIWVARHERVSGRPAVRYDGVAHDKVHFSIWLSDDAARVPLLCSTETALGTISVKLVEYG